MKVAARRPDKGCPGCEAKACGASAWEVGYVVGAHYTEAFSHDDEGRVEAAILLCARHRRKAVATSAKEMVWVLRRASG